MSVTVILILVIFVPATFVAVMAAIYEVREPKRRQNEIVKKAMENLDADYEELTRERLVPLPDACQDLTLDIRPAVQVVNEIRRGVKGDYVPGIVYDRPLSGVVGYLVVHVDRHVSS